MRKLHGAKAVQKKIIKQQIRQSRPVHKKVLLHPVAIMVLLCTVVLVANWTYTALADTTISSQIFAPAITRSAVIRSPSNNTTLTTQNPVVVSGTCPDQSYVALNVNDTFTGVDLCNSGNFSVQTSLFSGSNTLSVQAYNVSDQAGPMSSTVMVNLKTPYATSALTPSQTGTSIAPSSAVTTAPPLLLTSNFEWKTFQAGTTFAWDMDVEGGVPPYTVHVDWGDNQSSTYVFPVDPTFTISHVYAHSGYFAINASSVDARSSHHIMQLAALISSKHGTSTFFGAQPTGPSTGSGTTTTAKVVSVSKRLVSSSRVWLWIAWPSLGVVALMMFSFWLGEIQDRQTLLAQVKPRSKRQYR
jgi:hypothetical protein